VAKGRGAEEEREEAFPLAAPLNRDCHSGGVRTDPVRKRDGTWLQAGRSRRERRRNRRDRLKWQRSRRAADARAGTALSASPADRIHPPRRACRVAHRTDRTSARSSSGQFTDI